MLSGPALLLRPDVSFPVEWLVGPVAGLAVLLVVARELWRAHRESDDDLRRQRDALSDRLDRLVNRIEKAPKEPPV